MAIAAPKLNTIETSYKAGKIREDVVSDILQRKGYQVASSTWREDKEDDIDLWVSGKGVSVKAPKRFYPNLCLEHYIVLASGDLLRSWFLTSKAEYLALLQPDDTLVLYSFEALRRSQAVEDTPFTGLSQKTRQKSKTMKRADGTPYGIVDAKNKNVPLNLLTGCIKEY